MIYLTGDTHGKVDSNRLLSHTFKKDDILIILGDFGWVFTSDISYYELEQVYREEFLKSLGCTVLFIDGNHENFDRLNNYPISRKFGGKVHKIADNCYHLLRGEIYTIEGKTFLTLGGGLSLDFRSRTLGVNWWLDELIADEDVERALKALEKRDFKIDFVLTHSCPFAKVGEVFKKAGQEMFESVYVDLHLCERALDRIYNRVDFKKWYCGHYHMEVDLGDVQVLYKSILPLDN